MKKKIKHKYKKNKKIIKIKWKYKKNRDKIISKIKFSWEKCKIIKIWRITKFNNNNKM